MKSFRLAALIALVFLGLPRDGFAAARALNQKGAAIQMPLPSEHLYYLADKLLPPDAARYGVYFKSRDSILREHVYAFAGTDRIAAQEAANVTIQVLVDPRASALVYQALADVSHPAAKDVMGSLTTSQESYPPHPLDKDGYAPLRLFPGRFGDHFNPSDPAQVAELTAFISHMFDGQALKNGANLPVDGDRALGQFRSKALRKFLGLAQGRQQTIDAVQFAVDVGATVTERHKRDILNSLPTSSSYCNTCG